MTDSESRLARIEEKIDAIQHTIERLGHTHEEQEKRLRSLEIHRGWLWGAWAAAATFFKFLQ